MNVLLRIAVMNDFAGSYVAYISEFCFHHLSFRAGTKFYLSPANI
jgi:hypothetical protein